MRTTDWIALLVTTSVMGCGGGNKTPDDMSANSDGGYLVDPLQEPAKSIVFSISGEVLSLGGYDFPPPTSEDAAFTDGWQVRFDKLLVTVDQIQLHTMPNLSPTDQSQEGSLVAELDGPWAFDLHKGGPITGKGGVAGDGIEEAYPFAVLLGQNKVSGSPKFDPSQTYAFGFSTVPATTSAKRVNVDANDPDYATMIQNGCTVYYIGTATWKGGSVDADAGSVTSSCTTSIPSYDFSQVPTTVSFQLCYKSPTSYENCQNPDQHGDGIGGEDSPRGIIVNDNSSYVAQLTIHTDHPLWESVLEDSPLHFDQMASNAKKQSDGSYLVTLDDVKGKDWQAMTDAAGNALPWRACLDGYTPPSSMQMSFDGQGLPDVGPSGDPSSGLRDYLDFTTYVQSTQGHLNSNGLCYVKRNYPSPSGT
jgi:hypothetical protein